MTEVYLKTPQLNELDYYAKLLSDPDTMSYNAGYNLDLGDRYDYNSGCIDFPKEIWEEWYNRVVKNDNNFLAYIIRSSDNQAIGYLNFKYHPDEGKHSVGVIIEGKHRGMGYARPALKLMLEVAFKEYNVKTLTDGIPASRVGALHLFKSFGFQTVGEDYPMKFGNPDKGFLLELNKEDYFNN